MEPDRGSLWVVIDPMRAFTDTLGTLAAAYGNEELSMITATVPELARIIQQRNALDTWVWVRSTYDQYQFEDSSATPALSHLCTGKNPVDLEWDPALAPFRTATVVTKHFTDATSTREFADLVLDAASLGAPAVILTGFLFTSCVRDTALSVASLLQDTMTPVIVRTDLAAARASQYTTDDSGTSPIQRVIADLHRAGVDVRDR